MYRVFRLIAAAGIAASVSGAALAADAIAYEQAPAPAYEEAGAPFDGAYVGGHIGAASRKLNPFSSGNGFVGGLQGGYNKQFGNVVIGGELEGSSLGGAEVKSSQGRIKERWRGAAKAKLGAAIDNTLIYGTAGVTTTKYRDGRDVNAPEGWKQGWLYGVGVEQALGNGLSAKLEYNRTRTNDVRTHAAGGAARSDIRDNVLKAG
ncbi:porin family protein, partial [Salmonella enterica subsp. enterica serovar Panama]|nr:porin family protein [Salmonella enterica subsp. enterica serovar Panama]